MEVTRGIEHACFSMDDLSCVGAARRHAAGLAQRAQWDDVMAGRLALVVTELGSNLVRHASGGFLLAGLDLERREVEIVAVDRGPGIVDWARSLSDGYSTGGTPGTGLGAVRRLASDLHLHSAVPDGTVVVARLRATDAPKAEPQASVTATGLSVALAGEIVCGDGWAVSRKGSLTSAIVTDGLGHGPDAAEASQVALDVFVADPLAPPRSLVAAMHIRMRSTRGAAVMVLHLDSDASQIRSCGAGNVAARVISGDTDRSILTQHGTAGVQIRTPEEVTTPWPQHAIVAVHTDGIESRWNASRLMPVLKRDPALAASILLRDHSRKRDDATVLVLRRGD